MPLTNAPRRTLLLSLLGATQFAWSSGKVIRISNGDWPPFMSPSNPHNGFVSRIVTEAFRIENVTVRYEFFPWARAYLVAQRGEFDASIGWYWNEERARDFLFSDPVFIESQVLFHLKEKPFNWTSLNDLKGKSIGATLGYTYGDGFKQIEESKFTDVQRVPSDEQNLRKLLAGRVDAVVMSKTVGERLLRSFNMADASRIAFNPRPVNSGPLHVIFPKNMPQGQEWMTRFNRGLAQLKARGAVERYSRED